MEWCDGAMEWWPAVLVLECPEMLMPELPPLLLAADDDAGVRRMLLGPAVIGVLGAVAWTGIRLLLLMFVIGRPTLFVV